MTQEPSHEMYEGLAERALEKAKKKVPFPNIDEATYKIFFRALTEHLTEAIAIAYRQGRGDGERGGKLRN